MKRDHDRLRRGVAHLYQMGQKYSRRSWINYCVEQYRNTNWVPTQYADEVLAQINPHGAPQVPVVSVVPLVSTPDSAVDMQQDWNYDSGAEMSLEQIMAANPVCIITSYTMNIMTDFGMQNGAEMMLEPFQALNNSWLSGFEFELPTFGMDVLEPSWGLMTQQQPEDPAAMACPGYQQEVERQQVVSTYEVAGGAPDVPVRADTVGSGVQGSGYIDPALLCNNTIGSSMEEIGEWLQQLDRAPGAGGYVWIGGDDVAAEGVLSDSSIDALMARFTESGEEEAKDEAEFDDGEFDDLF